jgi:alanyl-tRNA synthetase
VEKDELRLIEIKDFDLTACGGTHVQGTGQIGAILLRKTEKVKQGWRVEFVCGMRAVKTARLDYRSLTEAAGLFSGHIREVGPQITKMLEEARAGRKAREALLEELADLHAVRLLAEMPETNGRKVVAKTFAERDLAFIKLLAQRLTRQGVAVVALLGSTAGQPSVVFAASGAQDLDMGGLMKEALATLGGRGGGSKDMAQGGVEKAGEIAAVLKGMAARLRQ